MNVVVALAGPIIALLGVWLGTRMNTRAQLQAREQEVARHAAETRRATYASHLAAIRAYVTYVVAHPDEALSSPRVDALREALETTYTELQLIALSHESVRLAHTVSRAARRIARAAAAHDPELRARQLVFWELERALVNQLRLDLGQATPIGDAHDPDAVLP